MHRHRYRLHLLDVRPSFHHRDPAPGLNLPPATAAKWPPRPLAGRCACPGAVRVVAQLSAELPDDDQCDREESQA